MLRRVARKSGPVFASNAPAVSHDYSMQITAVTATSLRYRIGIDVGTHSTGFCAVQVNEHGAPVALLNSMVFMHDSGIDPDQAKYAKTRKATSGVARRTRRLYRSRRTRLAQLDEELRRLGYPIVDLETLDDPRAPWHIRARLTNEFILDEDERRRSVSIALRHIARHRGWRNPYSKVESLLIPAEPSQFLRGLGERVSDKLDILVDPEATPGEVLSALFTSFPTAKIRGPEGILQGKLFQSDNAQEIRLIASTQRIEDDERDHLIRCVFQAKSPRGSAQGLRGKDALPGQTQHVRAEKAHPAFQLFRIVAVLTNLRIREGKTERRLSTDELQGLVDFLLITGEGDAPSWAELADNLGIERSELRGTAKPGPDGTPALSAPPLDATHRAIIGSAIPWLVDWWISASAEERGKMIDALSNSGGSEDTPDVDDEIAEVLEQASEGDQELLDKLALPSGRAAYSLDSLQRLTECMLTTGMDLHEARKALFGVDDSWQPPADPIGMPVGNPAVDRVTKQLARWLRAAERRWGTPESINIEHIRNALGSEHAVREAMRDNEARFKRNQKMFSEMHDRLGLSGRPRRSDLIRYQALQRQNGECLYCGTPIDFTTAEMDHIVPRSGAAGSTNTRNNLAAVCRPCNHAKGNLPFAVWAESDTSRGATLADASRRVRHFLRDEGVSPKDFKRFQKDVISRLKSKSLDEEFDGRSMESVAWMASELRMRIDQHFNSGGRTVDVNVYRGALTAEARKASGFEGRVNLIGGGGKTRFDRRHHAMDALTIAMMNRSVAMTLAIRQNLRSSQQITGETETWKTFTGVTDEARKQWERWNDAMRTASDLFNLALTNNAIPIVENTRLRQGSGAMHEAKIQKLIKVPLSSALSAELIDRASTPALWTALTRCSDYDEKDGLPSDPHRSIVVNGHHIRGEELISFFNTGSACIAVRGGYAELGASIHHARIYRIDGKTPVYAMVRVYQVDLVRHRNEDLFSCEIPQSSISLRTAEKKIRQALRNGTATQIGWLVEGDELMLDPSAYTKGAIGELLAEYPTCKNWRVAGFPGPTRLRLRPYHLSPEGLPENLSAGTRQIVADKGWRPTINSLLNPGAVRVTRRTALGFPRTSGESGLPFSGPLR